MMTVPEEIAGLIERLTEEASLAMRGPIER